MNILANDGISQSGIEMLEKSGFSVNTTKVVQEQLIDFINQNEIVVLLVRSATKVRKDLIDACPNLKIIGRGGVGMDNIDVEYAKSKNIAVINTPAASSRSVAELVFAHLLGAVRFLNQANREMPLQGDTKFKELKKGYAKGVELRGKNLGIVGFGRIGKEVAKIALGLGMNVIARGDKNETVPMELEFFNGQKTKLDIEKTPMEELLEKADFITFHVPATKEYLIGENEIEKMKDGAGLINTARGGVLDEVTVSKALESGKLSFAALDVFEKEPSPEIQLLMNPKLSLSPHIGGATVEAQDRIGTELAEQIIDILK